MRLKNICVRIHWLMRSQFGIDLKMMIRSLLFGLPRYLRDFLRFRSSYTGRLEKLPCLHDWYEEGGAGIHSEYMLQDLLVAKMIFKANPEKHVDIGSRMDGFVAHVASFREIEVFDVRPITKLIPGVIFKQADFMSPIEGMEGYCDSLSCLHALEHFGLGRYGDPIDSKGFERGLVNMATLLRKDGIYYLSVPIGIDRVEFNAHRVFDPRVIVDLARSNSLYLMSLTVIRQESGIEKVEPVEAHLADLANHRYALGIFIFEKRS